jgi:hypothetical protein
MKPELRLCVLPYGIRVDRTNLTSVGNGNRRCPQVPHIHLNRSKAEPLIKAGAIRQIKGLVYQRTSRASEQATWGRKRSGRQGPIVLQMNPNF